MKQSLFLAALLFSVPTVVQAVTLPTMPNPARGVELASGIDPCHKKCVYNRRERQNRLSLAAQACLKACRKMQKRR